MFRKPEKRPERRLRSDPIDRAACARRAVSLFNQGQFWDAHEALERIWRSVPDEGEAKVLQGLIQAAAALLHRERGNSHGVRVVGEAALDKLRAAAPPGFPVETARFAAALRRCLEEDGPVPPMELIAGTAR